MKTHDIPHHVGTEDQTNPRLCATAAPRCAHFFSTSLSALLALAAIVGPAAAAAEEAVPIVNSGQEVIFAEQHYQSWDMRPTYGTTKLYFDVPEGKRLIVEMINVSTTNVPANVDIQVSYYTERTNPDSPEPFVLLGPLPMVRLDFGAGTRYSANHLVKLRVDSRPGDDEELVLFFERQGTGAAYVDRSTTINGIVHGYLVDLEPAASPR